MNTFAKVLLVLGMTFSLVPTTIGAFGNGQKGMSREEFQRMYSDFLRDEGYKPVVDDDGDVRFKYEGKTYFIQVSENDPQYFRIAFANFWPIENEKELGQAFVAANDSNMKSKVSKVLIIRENVWVSLEIFVGHPDDFKQVFSRSMSALNNGVDGFVKKMRELNN